MMVQASQHDTMTRGQAQTLKLPLYTEYRHPGTADNNLATDVCSASVDYTPRSTPPTVLLRLGADCGDSPHALSRRVLLGHELPPPDGSFARKAGPLLLGNSFFTRTVGNER